MIVSVFRKAHFNAAHRLHNPSLSDQENKSLFGLCNNPNFHGHNYMLEIKVTGEIDPVTGYVIDTKILKDIIQREVHDRFDHRNLNIDTEEFKHLNPTAENIAVVIYNLIKPHLNPNLDLALRLYETENNFVEFNGK
ncbi:MAG: 6-pyruvoyl trahydropterin synthase family protein [Chitinophagaceae bacterium]